MNNFSLGAALAVCHQCAAISPAREMRLLDRVTVDRCSPGQQVLVRMNGVPATDSRGRIAHVRGLYIHAEASCTILTGANDVLEPYQARSIWPSIFLRDFTGHEYLSDIDARTILDDQYFRFGSMLQWPAMKSGVQASTLPLMDGSDITARSNIPANVGAGTHTIDVSFYMPFVNPGANKLRGLIPLAALQRVSNNALTIRVGNGFAGDPGQTIDFDNLQVPDMLSGGAAPAARQGFDIWADIVWLSGLVTDAPWSLHEYTNTDLSGILRHPERVTEYAWIRHFPEDPSEAAMEGQNLATQLQGISLTVAGFNLKAGQLVNDAITDMYLDEMTRHSGAVNRQNAGQSLPLIETGLGHTALSILPFRQRHAAAAGPVVFEFNDRTSAYTRWVQRTVGCHTATRGKAIEQRLRLGPCSVVGTNHAGTPGPVAAYEPVISVPQKVNLTRGR